MTINQATLPIGSIRAEIVMMLAEYGANDLERISHEVSIKCHHRVSHDEIIFEVNWLGVNDGFVVPSEDLHDSLDCFSKKHIQPMTERVALKRFPAPENEDR